LPSLSVTASAQFVDVPVGTAANHGVFAAQLGDDRLRFARALNAFVADVDFADRAATYNGRLDVTAAGPCPVFESFLRALASGLLLRDGGALLHGASCALDGGFVFCGLSGAGKTTLVEGTADGVYLSDDQSIVTSSATGFDVWGSPFSGLAARRAAPIAHPLTAFVLLESTRPSSTIVTRRTDRARVVAELMRHVCAFEATKAEADRALAFALRMVETTPVFTLERNLRDSLVDVLARIRTLSQDRTGVAA
jgi:hypothetical protein